MSEPKEELVRALLAEPKYLKEVKTSKMVHPDENDPDRKLVELMLELDRLGITPTLEVMQDQLREVKAHDLLSYLEEAAEVTSSRTTDYMIDFLCSQYNERELFRIYNEGIRMLAIATPDKVADWVDAEKKACIIHRGARKENQSSAIPKVFERMRARYEGKKLAIWPTGYRTIDRNLPLAPRNIILWAAREKAGKTRVVKNIVRKMMKHTSGLKLIWFHFEMDQNEMVAMDVAIETGIPTGTIKMLTAMPSDQEYLEIMHCEELLARENVTLYGDAMNMGEIRKEIENNADEQTIVVIDNLGLIRAMPGIPKGNDHDDYVAAELKDVRDTTGALIMPIHHLSKAVSHYTNKANYFEPNIKDLRGSARISDYANATVLLHRASQYSELEKVMSSEEWAKAQKQFQLKATGRDISGEVVEVMGHDLGCCRIFDI